jgi:hypothetical protein
VSAFKLGHRKTRFGRAQDHVHLAQFSVLAFQSSIFSAISRETSARFPLFTAALLTQSFGVCGAQPIFAEIDKTAYRREPYWLWLSKTKRMARLRTSGENLFFVLPIMLHPAHKFEPPANPARLISAAFRSSEKPRIQTTLFG